MFEICIPIAYILIRLTVKKESQPDGEYFKFESPKENHLNPVF